VRRGRARLGGWGARGRGARPGRGRKGRGGPRPGGLGEGASASCRLASIERPRVWRRGLEGLRAWRLCPAAALPPADPARPKNRPRRPSAPPPAPPNQGIAAMEMAVLSMVQHPNIVQLYSYLTDMVEVAGEAARPTKRPRPRARPWGRRSAAAATEPSPPHSRRPWPWSRPSSACPKRSSAAAAATTAPRHPLQSPSPTSSRPRFPAPRSAPAGEV
jgi:hypothetical protein